MSGALRQLARCMARRSAVEGMCAHVGPGEASGAALGRLTSYSATHEKGAPKGASPDSTPPTGHDDTGLPGPLRARLWRLRAEGRRLSDRATVQTCGVLGAWYSDGTTSQVHRTVDLQMRAGSRTLDGSAYPHAQPFRPVGTMVTEYNRTMRPAVTLVRTQRAGKTVSRVQGVHACGSVHECPVCRMRIVAARSQEITDAVAAWRARGGVVLLVTLTVRHHWGGADELVRQLRPTISAMRSDRAWRRWWRELRIGRIELDPAGKERVRMDYVNALETTHGAFGWHPHCHALVFVERLPVGTRERARALSKFRRFWSDACARELGEAHRPSLRRGVDVQVCEGGADAVGGYLSKLGLELTFDLSKRGAGETPLQILERAADGRDDRPGCIDAATHEARTLWRRYARAMLGLRQLTWSHGTRCALALPPEPEDEDLAVERPEDTDERVLEIPARAWAIHLGHRPELVVYLLDGISMAESREAARRWAWLALRRRLGEGVARELALAEGAARAQKRREEKMRAGKLEGPRVSDWAGRRFASVLVRGVRRKGQKTCR